MPSGLEIADSDYDRLRNIFHSTRSPIRSLDVISGTPNPDNPEKSLQDDIAQLFALGIISV